MAEHADGEPDPVTPNSTEPSGGDEENPRGLLFISDVQALRRADAVSFTATEGAGYIDAALTTLADEPLRIYTANEQRLFPDPVGPDRRRRIAVAADIAGYDHRLRWHDHQIPGATAAASIGGAPLHDVWRTIAAFLRVGDILRLRWQADITIDGLTVLGLHRDDLRIEVRRGARVWTFLLDVTVRPPHNRMINAPHR